MDQARRKTGPARILPVPSMLTRSDDESGKHWRVRVIRDYRGQTSTAERIMNVPAGPDRYALGVRQHEMLHAKWTPGEISEPMDDFMLAAEDGRIEFLATRRGLTREPVMPDSSLAEMVMKTRLLGENALLACIGVAGIGGPGENRELYPELAELLEWAEAEYDADPSFASAVKVARRLREMFRTTESAGDGRCVTCALYPPAPGPDAEDEGDPLVCEDATDGLRAADLRNVDLTGTPGQGLSQLMAWGGRPWSVPQIESPPRVRVLRKPGVLTRAKDTGTVPVAMHRLTTDSRVFAVPARRQAEGHGTVLVDMSGSMSEATKAVAPLIRQVPATVIAGYWGGPDPDKGTIRVLAANGKMVADADLAPTDGGNQIDLPAIEYLGQQDSPRIWVSDGGISTSYNHYPTLEQQEFFWRRVRELGVRQVDPSRREPSEWIQEVVRLLKKAA